jgi:hypothetical protein
MCPIRNGSKQRNTLLPLLFNLSLEYVIRWIEVNLDGLKLNGTHQLLVYADVIMLGGSVHTMKKKRGLVPASKETGLEVNVDKTKYMVMSRDQNAAQNHNIKTQTKSLKGWNISNFENNHN